MTVWQWVGVAGIVGTLLLAACYVWAANRVLNTISEWDDTGE